MDPFELTSLPDPLPPPGLVAQQGGPPGSDLLAPGRVRATAKGTKGTFSPRSFPFLASPSQPRPPARPPARLENVFASITPAPDSGTSDPRPGGLSLGDLPLPGSRPLPPRSQLGNPGRPPRPSLATERLPTPHHPPQLSFPLPSLPRRAVLSDRRTTLSRRQLLQSGPEALGVHLGSFVHRCSGTLVRTVIDKCFPIWLVSWISQE